MGFCEFLALLQKKKKYAIAHQLIQTGMHDIVSDSP